MHRKVKYTELYLNMKKFAFIFYSKILSVSFVEKLSADYQTFFAHYVSNWFYSFLLFNAVQIFLDFKTFL